MSTTGSSVEQDVFLGVDGSQIKAAFDLIDARILGIQKHITTITARSAEAAKAFGGGLQGELIKFNKISGQLDSFYKRVNSQNPDLKRTDDINKAYAARDKQLVDAANNRAKQEAQLWAQNDRQQTASALKLEQTKERLAVQRWERERAREVQAEKEQQRLATQNQFKAGRETMRADVEGARSLKDLENQRLVAVQGIAQARGMLGKFGAQEDNQLHMIIAQERERLRLAQARINTEKTALNKTAASDSRIDQALNLRSARNTERDLAATLALGTAKQRQAGLEADIAMQIARTRYLTGQSKIDAEKALKIDEARLQVINQRVRALQAEHDRNVALAQKANATPSAPSGGGGGLFGNSGLLGVFARTAAYGGAAAAMYATIGAIKDGITYSIQFDDAIAKLGAISGATGTQMKELAGTIADVGKQSRFSTLDLAEAATTLAQAGFTQQEIADSLKGISQLATASGVTIAEATDVVTAAIGSFQLQASETGHINDVLASALNRTKLNIQQVALGIQYAGATAHEQNITFEELTATMATMANAGIRSGSTIGTGLRQFLVDLQTPTKQLAAELTHLGLTMNDIDVKHLGLPEVLNRLAAAGFDSAAAYKTLETRAAAAYLILRNNRSEIQEQIIAQNQIGQSAEAAAKGQDTLAGAWQRFKNIINDGVHNGIQPAEEALRDYLNTINEVGGDETVLKLHKAYDATSSFDFAAQARIQDELERYLALQNDLIDVEAAHATQIEETSTAYNKATEEVGKQRNTLASLDDALTRVYVRGKELSTNQLALQAEVATLSTRFQGLAGHLDNTTLSYGNLTNALREYRLEQLKLLGQALQTQAITARQQGGAYIGQANSITQTGMSTGAFSRLPKNVQDLYKQTIKNPGNDTLRKQLFDASANLSADLKHFVDEFSISLDKGVNALRASASARGQLDVVGHLSTEHGAALQAQVSALAGKSDGEIKAFITKLGKRSQGKSTSVQAAYAALIQQAQGFIGSGSAPEAPPGKKDHSAEKAAREAARKEREEDRRDSAMLQLRMKADEAELRNAVKDVTKTGGSVTDSNGGVVIGKNATLTTAQLAKNIQSVNESFDKWAEDRIAQVKNEIDKQNMSADDPRAKSMMDDVQREIDEKRKEINRQVGEQIVKAMDLMVKAIEDTAKLAQEAADHQLNLAESRLASLDRANLKGRVPDYVRATAERAVDRAKDARDQQTLNIQEKELNDLLAKRIDLEAQLQVLRENGISGDEDPVDARLKELNLEITQLSNSTDELKATFGGEGLIPQSFSANLQMAIENFKEINHLTASWSEMIGMNLTDALGSAQGILTQFLTDAQDRTVGVIGAWRNMVMSIIKYLQQLLIKMVAVKIMQLALSAFGGSAGGAEPSVAGQVPLESMPGAFWLHGGEVKALTGRYIKDGVPNRDSVRARIAKGEYVVRKSAVDSVGVDFMNNLNERGAMAMKAMSPKIIMPPPAQQNMNVYVVAPENRPQMGPNDVLVTIANDIYRGGPTKQLIKQVVQGG